MVPGEIRAEQGQRQLERIRQRRIGVGPAQQVAAEIGLAPQAEQHVTLGRDQVDILEALGLGEILEVFAQGAVEPAVGVAVAARGEGLRQALEGLDDQRRPGRQADQVFLEVEIILDLPCPVVGDRVQRGQAFLDQRIPGAVDIDQRRDDQRQPGHEQ